MILTGVHVKQFCEKILPQSNLPIAEEWRKNLSTKFTTQECTSKREKSGELHVGIMCAST